ncbi:auxin response factor 18-like [Andrographis paniculata]|uniref:auxin response factor 18-like n=1 Tax=Andrographis paniculata TaxID=175694 RepID=UPI0021E91660|nr:auxin response factor 18-like [Andrographis paniculata]
MFNFMEPKEKAKEGEKCLDSQLWHACAGSMVQMPPVGSKVIYFPQGHLEHASAGNADLRNCPRFPAYVPCKVSEVKFMADPDTDEVFAKIRLSPMARNEANFDGEGAVGFDGNENQDKPVSFAKTLTQSDANNGGGFSVPRYCAETIFPRLDYSADPPVQTVLAKDVHGEVWKFRHIYRGTPRRHLLTTGWSTFVNHKKLVAGDSIVFLRAENGDLCVGIRRAKKGIGGGPEVPPDWNPMGGGNHVPQYRGFSAFLREDESKMSRNGGGNDNRSLMSSGRVKVEDVIDAATRATTGQLFEAVYYPRASTPEFCVKAGLVKAALQIHWCSGMRFKMAFETEDSSRISWFMGTISSVQVADPVRWPDSPWRLLQVRWDEPDLLQNVKRVSPWLVELVSNIPAMHLSPFSPPHKKLKLPHHPEFPLGQQLPLPAAAFSGNHFLGPNPNNAFTYLSDNNVPAGMQGARHAQYGLSLPDVHLNKLHSGFAAAVGFQPFDRASVPAGESNLLIPPPGSTETDSCLLTIANSGQKSENRKAAAPFLLFGQPILTEKQISMSCSSDTVSTPRTVNSSSDCNVDKIGNSSDGSGSGVNRNDAPERSSCEGFQSQLSLQSGQCKVFMESEDVGRTLDLTLLGSYEELNRKLADMFGVENPEIVNHVLYRDAAGSVRQLGDEPFSNFVKTTKRLTVVADSGSDNVGV